MAYVDEKGNVDKVKIIKGLGAGCDEEVVRVLRSRHRALHGCGDCLRVDYRDVIQLTALRTLAGLRSFSLLLC